MRRSSSLCGVLLAALLSAVSSFAQTPEITLTGQPQRYPIHGKPYETQGFGNVRFGMTMAEVKARIPADYPHATSLTEGRDPVEGTTSLNVVVPQLAPGPGPATINYIFGATSHQLVTVHVFWLLDGNPDDEARHKLLETGTLLVSSLIGFEWQPLSIARGHVVGPSSVVLFSARDMRGGGVEIRLDGVAFDVERARDAQGNRQPPEHRPAPPGPAWLRVSFASNVTAPDVYRLPTGLFVSGPETPRALHGFRGVRFGMMPDEATQALAADLPNVAIDRSSDTNGGAILRFRLASLEPSAAPATLRLVHDANTQRLIAIDVEWRVTEPSEDQRAALGIDALRLINHFRENGIADVSAIAPELMLKSDGIALYAGADPQRTLVQLHVGGIPVEDSNGQTIEARRPVWMLMRVVATAERS